MPERLDMRIQGDISKDGNFWLVNIPILGGILTQGMTKNEAYSNAKDYVECISNKADFTVEVFKGEKGTFEIGSTDTQAFMALILKAHRNSENLTLRQVADHLGDASITAYANVESGKVKPTMERFQRYYRAVSKKNDMDFVLSPIQCN